MPPTVTIFPDQAAVDAQREWERFGEIPVTIGPLTDPLSTRPPVSRLPRWARMLLLLAVLDDLTDL